MGSSPIFRARNFENRPIGRATNLCLVYIGVWCNGSTRDFDSLGRGSNPCTPAIGALREAPKSPMKLKIGTLLVGKGILDQRDASN